VLLGSFPVTIPSPWDSLSLVYAIYLGVCSRPLVFHWSAIVFGPKWAGGSLGSGCSPIMPNISILLAPFIPMIRFKLDRLLWSINAESFMTYEAIKIKIVGLTSALAGMLYEVSILRSAFCIIIRLSAPRNLPSPRGELVSSESATRPKNHESLCNALNLVLHAPRLWRIQTFRILHLALSCMALCPIDSPSLCGLNFVTQHRALKLNRCLPPYSVQVRYGLTRYFVFPYSFSTSRQCYLTQYSELSP
jgi:hypothetical protein